jgi:hypothetical protein
MYYFNNSRRRPHGRLYGSGAFFDLNTTGVQRRQARNLMPGEECIVATPDRDGAIVFSWFSFAREEMREDETGTPVRVLFGRHLKSERLSKGDAASDPRFQVLFDRNNNFKRQSVFHR